MHRNNDRTFESESNIEGAVTNITNTQRAYIKGVNKYSRLNSKIKDNKQPFITTKEANR